MGEVNQVNSEQLKKHFAKIGARVKFRGLEGVRRRVTSDYLALDVGRDRRGEYFDISQGEDAPELDVLQVVSKDRHLLLYARDGERFLCGHDERHWFVAAVEDRVSTVGGAKLALQPEAVRSKTGIFAPSVTDNRKNVVFKRQGEWFFVPVDSGFRVEEYTVFRNEPLKRNAQSKPHICDELCRGGGRLVYEYRRRIWEKEEFETMQRKEPSFGRWARSWIADPEVYVRGRVRHPDHKTLKFEEWHRVYINGEVTSSAVAFID
jgi:hypothetical protein